MQFLSEAAQMEDINGDSRYFPQTETKEINQVERQVSSNQQRQNQ